MAKDKAPFPPPRGTLPSIEWRAPGELEVDRSYQRSAEAEDSQRMIRAIAQNWDWRLCAPLTVSRRSDPPAFFVIDGQHRLEAAKLRGDIQFLPCIISSFDSIAEEASCFVSVNTARKRVTPLDTFRAQLAAGDGRAVQVMAVIDAAGLSLAPHGNHISWRPRQIACVAGVRNAVARHGEAVAGAALADLAAAFPDEPLQYAGRILAGLYPLHASPPPRPRSPSPRLRPEGAHPGRVVRRHA